MTNKRALRIAIASGKGGTGKTMISTSLFYNLAKSGLKVKLIDCDAEEPNDMVFFPGKPVENTIIVSQRIPVINENKCTFCGKCHDYCNYKAIFILPPLKIISVLEDLCHGCGACLAACEYDAITEKEMSLGELNTYSIDSLSSVVEGRMRVGVYSPVAVIKAAIDTGGQEHLLIMDAPPGTSCPFIQTAAKADYVILVTEPTPFGLSDLKQSVETLRLMNKPMGVIVNRAGIGNNQVYKYLDDNGIRLLSTIPFDKEIAMIYSEGGIVSREKPEVFDGFMQVFTELMENYGNSDYQR